MLIVFSGLDCSGKSTQIDLLKKSIIDTGANVLVFWSRGGYTPGFQLIKDLLRRFSGKKLPGAGHSQQRDKAFSMPIIRKVWLVMAILDLIFYYSVYIRVFKALSYTVICDRYLMDTDIDFKLAYPQEEHENWLLWKFLKAVAVKPDLHFVSTIPVPESIRRSKFKFEPFPDSPETLQKRLNIYIHHIGNNNALTYIDGMKSKEKTSLLVKNKFNSFS